MSVSFEQAKSLPSTCGNAGSEAGAALGASLAALAIGAAALVGATITAPIAAAIVVGTMLAGGYFGGDAAVDLYKLLSDRDANGKRDIVDKLGNLLFGANYTITSALPADLNGERFTLDTTIDHNSIIANARNSIAWRYALRELNPFVVTDVAYDRHNTDGSLDLYDPATGRGHMTEAYLADRAARLTWKLRFHKGACAANDNTWAIAA